MTERITLHQVVERLAENGIAYYIMPLAGSAQVVVSQRGGRIFGPFLSPDAPGILWLNPAFATRVAFRAFLAAHNWNLGGDRIWIGPEVQYNFRDRQDPWGSYYLPSQMDPGSYVLEVDGAGGCRLHQDLTLSAYNLASGEKELRIERAIRHVADPLRQLSAYPAVSAGLTFAGYQQKVYLKESRRDAIMSETWNLTQVVQGGAALVPASPCAQITDYRDPVDEGTLARRAGHLQVRMARGHQYKLGVQATHVTGRFGYVRWLDDGRACLIVRSFYNNPSAGYAEEPPQSPGRRGHSIHLYNDDGVLGEFGEIECQGQTIGGATGRSASHDPFVTWVYAGPWNSICQVAEHLLRLELDENTRSALAPAGA